MSNALQASLHWWNTWRERTVNRRIFGAIITVGGFTVLVKLVAVAKELVVAYQFGTSDALDAYIIAFVLPGFAINLIGSSLNAALIPTYIQVREQEGQGEAQRVFSTITVLSSGFLLALSGLLALSASFLLPLVASGFTPEKLALTHSLYYVLLSTVVISGLATTWGAILNAENHFALPAIVPIVSSIFTLLAVAVMTEQWGSYALVTGAVGGAIIEAFLLGWWLRREGFSLFPRWYGMSPAVKRVIAQYAPMAAASFLMSGTGVVSQSMATMLGPGSVSILTYGSKFTSLILGIGGVAVSTAVLPHFSRMVTMKDWHGLKHTLGTYVRLLFIVGLSVTLPLIYFSEPVVAMFFQRGKFTESDTHIVGSVQAMYLLQVLPYVVSMLFVRLLSALKANQIMLWGNIINISVCIILTYVLMQWLGVAGIALATSAMYLISFAFLWLVTMWLIKNKMDESGKA